METEFLSIKEVAVIFSVHEVTVRRAIQKGYIPYLRVGKGKKSAYRISKKFIESIHTESLRPFLKKIF